MAEVSGDVLAFRIRAKFLSIKHCLDELGIRTWCAVEAMDLGHGGIRIVHKATQVCCDTISRGIRELRFGNAIPNGRIRVKGGGRKKLATQDQTLLADLDKLIEPATRGDPENPLRWSSKSTPKLAKELCQQGHKVTQRTVYTMLDDQHYSMKSNRKVKEGGHKNPDRDAQFNFINDTAIEFQSKQCPVLSVDAKKKELVGEFKNAGKEWHRQGENTDVQVYDFIDKKLGKAAPYGVYDITNNVGWVSVGKAVYEKADDIMITADCGGSNGYRIHLWKYELQKLADEINKSITIRHFPPGTSTWNKIEHRMFSQITQNWRGRPLVSIKTIIELIANTTTTTGLQIKVGLDTKTYDIGRKVSDEELAKLRINGAAFHPEWNYTIVPRSETTK